MVWHFELFHAKYCLQNSSAFCESNSLQLKISMNHLFPNSSRCTVIELVSINWIMEYPSRSQVQNLLSSGSPYLCISITSQIFSENSLMYSGSLKNSWLQSYMLINAICHRLPLGKLLIFLLFFKKIKTLYLVCRAMYGSSWSLVFSCGRYDSHDSESL